MMIDFHFPQIFISGRSKSLSLVKIIKFKILHMLTSLYASTSNFNYNAFSLHVYFPNKSISRDLAGIFCLAQPTLQLRRRATLEFYYGDHYVMVAELVECSLRM